MREKFAGGVVEREIRLSSYVVGDLFNIDLKNISQSPYTIYRNYCKYKNFRWTAKGKVECKIPIAKKIVTAQFHDYIIPTTEYISFETPQYDFVDCFNQPDLLGDIGLDIYDVLIQNAIPFKESGPVKLFYNQLSCRIVYEEETLNLFHYDPIYKIHHDKFLHCLNRSFEFNKEPLQETQCIEMNMPDLSKLICNATDQCWVALKWDGTRCHINFGKSSINIVCYDGRLFSLPIDCTTILHKSYNTLHQLYSHVWFVGEYLASNNIIILIDVGLRTHFQLRNSVVKSIYRNFGKLLHTFQIYIQLFVPFAKQEKFNRIHIKLIKFWQSLLGHNIDKLIDGMIVSFSSNSLQYKLKYISSIDLLWSNDIWYLADGIQFGTNLNGALINLNDIVLEDNCIYEINILSKTRWIVNRTRKDKQQPNKLDVLYNILKIYYN